MTPSLSRRVLAVVALSAALSALAQQKASDIPVETFFRRPDVSGMALSPNGELLAALATYKGRDNLIVVDLAKKSKQVITSFEVFDVLNFQWINNKRLYLRVAEARDVLGRARYIGTYAIDVDGENLRNLTDLVGGKAASGTSRVADIEPLARTDDGTDDMIVGMNYPRYEALDVHRLDTRTGRSQKRLTVDAPADTLSYVLDWDLVPRVAVSLEQRKGIYTVWYRDSLESPWGELTSYPYGRGVERMEPLRFNSDNKTLFVASNIGRDKAAIYTYDPKTKKLGDVVFEHPMIDVWGGLLFDVKTRKLIGVRFTAEKPVTIWIDPDFQKQQRQVDATLPGKNNLISRASDNANRVLIRSYSDTDPGRYFLLSREPLRMEELLATRPGIQPELMAQTRFMPYKARDGLEIPAWVTLPKGSGKNLPLVVNIHGGPWARVYGFDQWRRPEAQFFASRGYAVLEPEPRASDGFGRKHMNSGFRQWGQTMQDDITDGVLQLVKDGIVDKSRVCLYGASYGGYATLMGLVKEPDLFKCGVPFVAVTDIVEFITTNEADYSQAKLDFESSLVREVGDPKKDRDALQRASPALHAKRIKAPVLMAMGQIDQRVPLVHGKMMRDAMEEAGVKYEYIVYAGEGHGWNKEENLFDWYKRVEAFLAKNLQ
jgi:dipeptidyl aminopeptidase/acylaminoacyl peptidase